MLETALFSRVRPKLREWGTFTRVENLAGPGAPDVHYCIDGTLGWIETKVTKGPSNKEVYFERFQIPWAQTYLKARCKRLFVLVGVDNSSTMLLYNYWTFVFCDKTFVKRWTVVDLTDVEPLLKMDRPYDWMSLRSILAD